MARRRGEGAWCAMARITDERFFCDICGKEVGKKDYVSVGLLVKFTTDQTEGRPCKPYFSREDFGLCWDCLDKTVVVEASGCMGHNHYRWRDER